MVREAISARVGLLFRPSAFQLHRGVLAVIGPRFCLQGGLDAPAVHAAGRSAPGMEEASRSQLSSPDDHIYNSWRSAPIKIIPEVGEQEKTKVRVRRAESMEQAFLRDARGNMRDQLSASPGWWILEYLPLWEIRVHHEGYMSREFK